MGDDVAAVDNRATERPRPLATGAKKLFISASIDKDEYERHVPLTPRAIEILERRATMLPKRGGLLFGKYQSAVRSHWHRAAVAAGIDPQRARKISIYDFRSAAGKRWLDESGGNLRGVAHLMGHGNTSTTANRYLRPDELAAESAVSDALARRLASESVHAMDTDLAAPAAPDRPLDEAEASDYTRKKSREGGGIGRRTSLRC